MNQFVPYTQISFNNKTKQNNMESYHHSNNIIDKDLHPIHSHIHYSNSIPIISQQSRISPNFNNNVDNSYYSPNHFSYTQQQQQQFYHQQQCIIPSSKLNLKIDTSKCHNFQQQYSQPQSQAPLVPTLNVNSILSPSQNNTPITQLSSSPSSPLSIHCSPCIDSSDIPSSLCIPLLKLKSMPPPLSSSTPTSIVNNNNNNINNNNNSLNNYSPRSLYYVPDGSELSPFITPTQSPRNHIPNSHSPSFNYNNNNSNNHNSLTSPSSQTSNNNTPSSSLSNTPISSPRGSNSTQINKVEEHWKKLEYYTNNLNHYVYESIKSKDFSNVSELNEKVEEIKNSIKEIEIINSIAKTLPPQTRARKKRSTKAEKLQRDILGVKRTYVTTPKSKGNHCAFCGTLETPEWRRGPGGHKTLCNACGLHYAKNLKKENLNQKKLLNLNTTESETDQMSNHMKIENLI